MLITSLSHLAIQKADQNGTQNCDLCQRADEGLVGPGHLMPEG